MNNHYYDYGPQQPLQRPVVLSGFFGSHPEQVGHAVAALTGLPFLSLARLVEHRAGASLAKILAAGGRQRLAALEIASLREQLPCQPYALIAVAEGTVLQPGHLQAMAARARHLHLGAALVESFWRVRRELQRSPGRYGPFLTTPPARVEDLEALYQDRAAGYGAAELTIPVAGLDALSSARAVLGALRLTAGGAPS